MGNIETLDILPGQGETKTKILTRTRKACEICGQDAHFKHSFLLKNFRSNPASSGYGRDDCSWASDIDIFSCKEHKDSIRAPEGYESGASVFSAIERFAHMFLEWKESAEIK